MMIIKMITRNRRNVSLTSSAGLLGLFLLTMLGIVLIPVLTNGQVSFQLIIGFGNVPIINLDNLPDYSVVIYTATPNAPVFIDGRYAGRTDIFGRLVVQFSEEGFHTLWIESSDIFLIYDRIVFKVEKKAKYVYATPIGLGKITVFSNVYPVYISLPNGRGAGIITKSGESVLLPAGSYEVVLASPGYENVRVEINVPFSKEVPLWVNFKPVEFNVELIIEPDKFSPNNDWHNDFCYIKIYSSRNAYGVLQITDFSGKIVYEKKIDIKAGKTEIKWDGAGNRDGTYTVSVLLHDGLKEIKKQESVIIDTSSYTYAKEIFIGFSLLLMGLILYNIFSGN